MSKGSTTRTQTAFSRPAADIPDVSAAWTHRPLQQKPMAAVIIVACLLAVIAWVAIVTGKIHLAVLAGGSAAVVLWRYYLPVVYQVGRDGLRQTVFRRSRLIPWSAVIEVRCGEHALRVIHRGKAQTASDRRQALIPWGANRDEVRACLAQLVPSLLRDDSDSTRFKLSSDTESA